MIPYFTFETINLPFLPPLHLFGLLVGIGVLVGYRFILWVAKQNNIPATEINTAGVFSLLIGFPMSHMIDTLFYHPDRLARGGLMELLKISGGLSSFGGFFGAILGLWIYYRWVLKKRNWWPHLDAFTQGLVVGWIFGRLGCTIAHDHPGRFTQFFLGVKYPDGVRHDLGFYEFLFTLLILFPMILFLNRYKDYPGLRLAAITLVYVRR